LRQRFIVRTFFCAVYADIPQVAYRLTAKLLDCAS
jgi:hypothetical protein